MKIVENALNEKNQLSKKCEDLEEREKTSREEIESLTEKNLKMKLDIEGLKAEVTQTVLELTKHSENRMQALIGESLKVKVEMEALKATHTANLAEIEELTETIEALKTSEELLNQQKIELQDSCQTIDELNEKINEMEEGICQS